MSNSTFIVRPGVFEALKKVDNNILKLDTINMDYIRLVDRPVGHFNLDDIIETMKAFEGHCIIQTMFMKGEYAGQSVDNTTDRYVLPWIEKVEYIDPSCVMIYTIDRETPAHQLKKAKPEELDRIAELLRARGIETSVSY